MKNNLYANVALLKYEQGEYEDHEVEVISTLREDVTLSEATDVAKLFLQKYAKDWDYLSYTGMKLFVEYWNNGQLKKTINVGNLSDDYNDDRDGLPVWQCDWEIGETNYFYPYE